MERIQTTGGGFLSGSNTGEGAVCRFSTLPIHSLLQRSNVIAEGPGTVYLQTRNPQSLGEWISAQIPRQG